MGYVERTPPSRNFPKGGWKATYRDPSGRERSRTFGRKIDADRHVLRQEGDKAGGAWLDPDKGRRPLADWVEEWWPTTVDLRPSSRARDESYLRTHVLPVFGQTPVGRVDYTAVRAWVADLAASGRAPATVAKAKQVLSKVMQGAVDAGLRPDNPCDRVPTPRVEREERRFLTPAQVATLADCIDPRYRALVLAAADGGFRIGELAGLRPARVGLLARTVEVAEIAVEVRGSVVFGPPKTRAGRRRVVLSRGTADALAAHMAAWPGPFVFPAPGGGVLRTPSWRRRFWQPAAARAGLDGLRPHDLRHTAISLWIAAGANPKEVAVRAGHSSAAVVLDRYGHLYDGADEALSDRIGALLASGSPVPDAAVVPLR